MKNLTGFDKSELLLAMSRRQVSVLGLALSRPTPSIEVMEENVLVNKENGDMDEETIKSLEI